MVVRFATLCDFSNDSTDGKLNLYGLTDAIYAHSFPCVHKSSHFVVSFVVEPDDYDAQRVIDVDLIDADGNNLLSMSSVIDFRQIGGSVAQKRLVNHRHIIHDLQVPSPGTYQFTIKIDGRPAHAFPFDAILVPAAKS